MEEICQSKSLDQVCIFKEKHKNKQSAPYSYKTLQCLAIMKYRRAMVTIEKGLFLHR